MVLGDARDLQELLRAEANLHGHDGGATVPFLTATVTSPPYGALLDYGTDGQIGFGQTQQEYLADCKELFANIFQWTKSDGVMWLVVDSYLGGSPHNNGVSGLEVLPFTLASMAQQVGWTLRETIIWRKDKTRPWTHKGKLRNAFEYVLLLVKSNDYKFFPGRLRETHDLARWWVQYPERYNVFGKVPDNVWDIPIPVQGSWAKKEYQHACPLPAELVRRLLLLTTDEGDVVLDPFAGLGTVVGVAEALGRTGFGVELNPSFVRQFYDHVLEEIHELVSRGRTLEDGPTSDTIINLRLLKYAKVLYVKLRDLKVAEELPILLIAHVRDHTAQDERGSVVGFADWTLVFEKLDPREASRIQAVLEEVAQRPPLSKYGVVGTISLASRQDVPSLTAGVNWAVYEHGRTWTASRRLEDDEIASLPMSTRRGRFPPLVSNRFVQIDLDSIGDLASADPQR